VRSTFRPSRLTIVAAPSITVSEETVSVTVTYDQALVLFEFFARFQDTDRLAFAHPAEYLALSRIAAQLDKAVTEMFEPDYRELVAAARARVAAGHDGDYPGPKVKAG
jgi:hypothetical protein